jgi:hypothetical protein
MGADGTPRKTEGYSPAEFTVGHGRQTGNFQPPMNANERSFSDRQFPEVRTNRRFPDGAEPHQTHTFVQILQKATKGTKGPGDNYGSLFPLLPYVKIPGFERCEICDFNCALPN